MNQRKRERRSPPSDGDHDEAAAFEAAFSEVYLALHRRRAPGERIGPTAWGTLSHLAITGPLTIGELSKHLSRAQSVTTEIVEGLEKRGLLARARDERDRRRVLVWLTDEGIDTLERERSVFDRARLRLAIARLPAAERVALNRALHALAEHAAHIPPARTPRN